MSASEKRFVGNKRVQRERFDLGHEFQTSNIANNTSKACLKHIQRHAYIHSMVTTFRQNRNNPK